MQHVLYDLLPDTIIHYLHSQRIDSNNLIFVYPKKEKKIERKRENEDMLY